MKYVCDQSRHLVCEPFSIHALHLMAKDLNLKRCWFHAGKFPHYDIPIKRISEIQLRCEIVSTRKILEIVKDGLNRFL